MVLGLPLIKATGIIINFIDKVVEVKLLDCPPFKNEFCCETKTIPVSTDNAPTTFYFKFEDVQDILQKTDANIAGVCERFQLAQSVLAHLSEFARCNGNNCQL